MIYKGDIQKNVFDLQPFQKNSDTQYCFDVIFERF